MTKEQLYGAMSLIDDEYIAESMTEYKPKIPVWVKRSLATAAVFVLVFAAAIGIMSSGFMAKSDSAHAPEGGAPTARPDDWPDSWLDHEDIIDLDAIVGISGDLTVGERISTGDGMISVDEFNGNAIIISATDFDIGEIGVLVFYGTSKGYYVEAGAPGANVDRDALDFDSGDLTVDLSATPDGRVAIGLDELIENGKTPTIIYLHVGPYSYRVELNTEK